MNPSRRSQPDYSKVISLKNRFSYHFTGARQTNRLDKPEWFFTQILTWARDNHLFVGSHIQPALKLAGHSDGNVRLEFVRGLVQLSLEKLCLDIEEISKNDHLFSHLIDETLAFEQEMRDTLGYPSGYPSAITVLTQAKYLVKWISIEERCKSSLKIFQGFSCSFCSTLQSPRKKWMKSSPVDRHGNSSIQTISKS